MNTLHIMRIFQRVGTEVEEQPTAETLSALCRNDVFRFALSRTGNRTTAEDIAVETFADALRGLTRFDGRVAVKIWLFGIARRKIANLIRCQKRRKETPLETAEALPKSEDSPEVTLLRREAAQQVRALLFSLPEIQREALLLQVIDNLSISEIAVLLSKSPSAINSLLGRARETLRRRGAAYFDRGGPLG